MVNTGMYVSLDIGTTSIKVVVAEFTNGQMNIIGVGNEKSDGLSRGIIVDIDKTVDSIKKAISQAEQKANVTIRNVIVGIPSNNIEIEPCHGMIAVSAANKEITEEDVQNVMSAAMVKSVPPEREIVALEPEEFIVDGFDGIIDPRGMIGVRLEMHAIMMTGPRTILHNTKRCVEKAGLSIQNTVLQPLATSKVAMSSGERDFGTILIDMGGGQTSASVLHDDQLKFSFVAQEGGEYVTRDISIVLNTTSENAERLKRDYGYALPDKASSQEEFPVEVIGQSQPLKVDEQYLSEIIEARLIQIFEKINYQLDLVRARELPGGIVLTGGAAALPGVAELAQAVFKIPVKLYIPDQMGMRYPSFSSAIGLIRYTADLDDIYQIAQENILPDTAVERAQQPPVQQKEYSDKDRKEEHSEKAKKNSVKQQPKRKEDTFGYKAKNFISNFFD